MKTIELEGATVPFTSYEKDGFTCYEFDTSTCVPPEPMVNAMLGLKLLDSADKRLVMINHRLPAGLFPKIEDDFEYESTEEEGKVIVTFKRKNFDEPLATDFSQNHCAG